MEVRDSLRAVLAPPLSLAHLLRRGRSIALSLRKHRPKRPMQLVGPSEIWTNVSSLIPREFTVQNYASGWSGFGGVTFITFFKNSLVVTGISTVAS